MLVEMTPFDLLSLQEGLMSAVIHLEHLKETNGGDDPKGSWRVLGIEAKLKDARANYKELGRVLEDREKVLTGV